MNRFFFHIHIWKTGGTTFLNICRSNFGKQFHRDIMLIQDWFLSIQQLQWLLHYHGWIRCYSCHMLSGDLPYDENGTEVIGLAFVRNPVSRFVSSYNFQSAKGYRGGFAKNNDFVEFYKKALVEDDNPMWRNGQTYVLGGSGTQEGLASIAERVASGKLVLLSMERFDESCILLEKLFPNDFKDCSYLRYNVSKQKAVVADNQQTEIAKYMDIDFKLLDLADDFLESSLSRLFQNENERRKYFEEFQKRCRMKKRRSLPNRAVGKLKRILRKAKVSSLIGSDNRMVEK